MSKIGTEVIVGQIFKPIVTTFTYDELKTYRDNDTSIGINNALIISVPQKQLDNAEYDDDIDETSIWATDNSGLLCPLSFPYSKISQIEESLKQYEENTTAKKILSVKWTRGTGTSEAGTSPNINIKVEVTYANNRTALLNITGIKVYKNPQFTEEYTTVVTGGETISWYDREGIYYLQGLITDNSTGGIMATTNEFPLAWTITAINKIGATCTYNKTIDNSSHYAEITLTSNIPGIFEIIRCTEGNLDISFGRIIKGGGSAIFKVYNNSYNIINPQITWSFTPDNTKYYYGDSGSFPVGDIEGIPEPHTYYWYAGPGPVNSSIMPGTTTEWHVINGNPSSIKTGELISETKINWVLAVPTKFGLNHISNGEDVTDAYDEEIITCADGVEYHVFIQISQSRKTDRVFIP